YKIIPGIARVLNSVGQIRTYGFTANELAEQQKHSTAGKHVSTAPPIHSIAFHQVSFRYNEALVLDRMDWQIQPGDFIGIAGHSGKGKTTLLNILLGFLSPDDGE